MSANIQRFNVNGIVARARLISRERNPFRRRERIGVVEVTSPSVGSVADCRSPGKYILAIVAMLPSRVEHILAMEGRDLRNREPNGSEQGLPEGEAGVGKHSLCSILSIIAPCCRRRVADSRETVPCDRDPVARSYLLREGRTPATVANEFK